MFNFSLHIHSSYSYDGYNSFDKIYKCSKKAGLDIIAITDHDRIDGAFAFQEWLKRKGISDIRLIIGEEITCLDGTHIIGLFLSDHIKSDTPVNVVSNILKQEGLVYFPHPTRADGIFSSNYCNEVIKKGHFIEVFNAKINNKYNIEAMRLAHKYPHLVRIGASDAHYNADILKSINSCKIKFNSNVRSILLQITNENTQIFGKINNGDSGYLPLYYKYKSRLGLPQFIKNIGKLIFSSYRNFINRNKVYDLELIKDSHE